MLFDARAIDTSIVVKCREISAAVLCFDLSFSTSDVDADLDGFVLDSLAMDSEWADDVCKQDHSLSLLLSTLLVYRPRVFNRDSSSPFCLKNVNDRS